MDGSGRGRGPARAGGGPSSRSPQAERRRKWRRRGRCSRLGQEPCQENTSSQRSPPIPAAARIGAGPPALLPPRSPRLGPIVWLGTPDEGRTGRRREGERGERVGGSGHAEGKGGSPALRSVGESTPSKVISVQASALSPPSPGGSGSQESGARTASAELRASVRGSTAWFPATGGCGSGCGLGDSGIRGSRV